MLKASAVAGFLLAPQSALAQTNHPGGAGELYADPGDRKVTLSWNYLDANPAITKWQYRQKAGAANYGAWTDIPNSAAGERNNIRYVVTGLNNGTIYKFKVRAVNSIGNGAESSEETATPTTTKTITLLSNPVNGRVTEGDTERKDIVLTAKLSEAAPAGGITVVINNTAGTSGFVNNDAETPGGCSNPSPATADICFPNGLDDITIAAGQRTGTQMIGILPDTRDERDEYFTMYVSADGWSGDTILLTIVDNDAAAPLKPPTGLTVEPGRSLLYLSWTAPVDSNRTGWEVRHRQSAGTWGDWTAISGASTTSRTIIGLREVYTYEVQLRATGPSSRVSTSVDGTGSPAHGVLSQTDSGAFLSVKEGGSKTYRINLKGRGAGLVTVTPDSTNTNLSFSPTSLRFTNENWDESQNMTVSVARDAGAADYQATITYSTSGGGYPTSVSDTLSVKVKNTGTTTGGVITPAQPTNVRATAGNRQVGLTWTKPPGTITGYEVRYTKTSLWEDWAAISGSSASTVSHTVTGLDGGSQYSFEVRAVNSAGKGVESDTVTATPTATPGVTISPPAAPTGLAAAAGNGQVVLTWTNPDDATITGYELRHGKTGARGSTSWSAIANSDADTITHTVTGLDNDSEYSFQLRAKNSAGESTATAWVTATPFNPKTITLEVTAIDSSPSTSTSISEGNTGSTTDVTVTIRLGEDPPDDVLITLASDPDKQGTSTGSTKAAASSCTQPLNPMDTDWCFPFGGATVTIREGVTQATKRVRILGDTRDEQNETINLVGSGSGWVSGKLTITITDDDDNRPAAPTNLTASKGDRQVVLSWTKPSGPITSYKLAYAKSTERGSATFAAITGSSASTVRHIVTGLDNDAEYSFKIRAVNASGDGAETGWVTATPVAPVAPVLTAATSPTNQGINLTWTHAGRAASDLVSNAVRFASWQASVRMKGGSQWRPIAAFGSPTTITTRDGNISLGDLFPGGTSVEVRVQALAYNSANTIVNGPWSGIRTVTYRNTATSALAITGAPVSVSAGATATYTVALTKAYGGTLSVTSANMDEATVSPGSLDFTTGDYNLAKTVTVTGVAAGTATINHAFRLTGASADAIPDAGTVAVTVNAASTVPAPVPIKPTGFTATQGSANQQAVLSWSDPNDASITKWQYSQDDTWKDVPSSSATTTTYTVTGLSTGTTYAFKVRAVNGNGDGVASDEASVTVAWQGIPSKPSGLAATAGNSEVTLKWAAQPNQRISAWEYQYKESSSSNWPDDSNSVTGTGATTSRTVSGLTAGTAYDFRIRASQGSGNEGPWSDAVTATPLAESPPSTPGVTVSEESLTVTEAAGASRTATYTVKLNTAPSGTVTVTPTSADPDAVMVSPANLRFTNSDYSTAQTVTVTGVDDADRTNESVMVNHGVMGYGSGATAVTSAASVTVMVTDDDRPAAPTGLTATGGNARVTLRWSDPDDASITEYEVQQKKGSDRWSSWSDINNSDASTVSHTVTGLENGSRYGFRIRAVNSNGASPESSEEQATPVASSTPGVTVSTSALTVEEGKMGTYTVVLDTAPSAMVTIMVGGASGEVKMTGSPLIFTTTNWDTAQTVTVNAGTDADTTNDTATLTHGSSSSDTNYGSSLDIDDVEVKVIDTTPVGNAGVRVTPTMLRLEEGGRTGTYRVVLGAMPSGNVTVTPSPTGADAAAVSVSGVLIFNASNWDTARMVTVTPVEDDDANDETVTVTNTVRGSGEYARVTAGSVTVAVEDDETAGVTVTPTELSLSEGGPTGSYTVKLNTDPEAAVTVTPVSNDAGAASVSGGPLTFTSSNWDTEQMVMVTPVNDDDANDETVTVSHGISGYSGVSRVDSVTVRVDDDDTAGVTVSTTRLSLTEGGSAGSYTVVLDSNPLATVTVTPASDDAGAATVSGGPLTFTSSNWSTEQIVMVTPVDDDDANDETVMVSHAISGYGGVSNSDVANVTVAVEDDETAGVTITPTELSLTEGGTTTTYMVVLDSNPLATVTLTPSSGDAGAAMVSTALSFDSSNWDIAQPVTVTAVNDGDINDEIVTVGHAITGYRGVSSSDVANVTVRVAEPGVTVTPTTLPLEEGGNPGTYMVVLDAMPSGNVTLTPSPTGADAAAARVSAALTFDSSNWSTAQSVTVTPVDDADANDETVMVGHAIIGYPRISDSDVDEVTVTVADDDTAGVTVTPTSLSLTEGGSTGTYTVKLNTMPSGNVTVTPGSGDTGAVMVSAALTFTPSNWDTARMVTVTPVGDDDADNETVTVTHAISGYGTVRTADSVMVMVTDDETEDRPQVEARKQELVGLSRATLGMATDMIGARVGGDLSGSSAGAGAIGEQALGLMENLLWSSHGSELSTNLSLEQLGEQLWNQSFHISQSDSERAIGEQRGRWSLWGAGELRSFKGDDASDAEDHSYSGSIKAGWLGVDYQFSNAWLAGLAVSFSSAESDYTYRSEDGTGAGKTETQLTTFYPYGSLQLTERLKLWGTAGIGFGDLRHQSNDDDSQQDGELKVYLAAIGFEQKLSSLAAWNLFSLAGDLAFVQSSTEWQDGVLTDQSVSITRARLGVNSSFPLSQTTTGYMNLRGRLDGGDLQMGAAEMVLGLRYSTGRFSALLQGRQTSALDGSYSESGILGELRFATQQDGTGLALQLQPSYGAYGQLDFSQAALWNEQQLQNLSGWSGDGQQQGVMALKSTIGYGFLLPDSNLLLTPFAEAAFTQATSHQIGLGLNLQASSWDINLSASGEVGSTSTPTGTVKLMFSKQL